jgi:NADH-quinone oxidoreductase subunit M
MTDVSHFPWLTVLLALPLLAALLCLLWARRPAACRWIALAATLGVLAVAVGLFACPPHPGTGWLRYEDHAWIPWFGIRYTLGLDGIGLLLVLLTGILQLAAILASWRREEHTALFFALLQFMEAGILGVLLSLDLILFYLFWEAMIIPMFFLIGIWGVGRQRIYAAVKLFLFTLFGSLLMLLAILLLYFLHGARSGDYTFALTALQTTDIPAALAPWLYGAFMLSFAIKAPLVPLHTWLPDAHGEGTADGSLDAAGLLVKVGVFGMLRVAFPLFPESAKASLPILAVLAFLGIFYSAWIAYAQKDIKRVVAYSSVAHVGFIVLGLCAWNVIAVEGSVLQLFNAGVTTAALFLMVGMVQTRLRTRQIDQLGGLWARAPVLSAFFLFFSLSALGLPGLNNFAGEILILIGTFRSQPLWGALAMGGMLFAAAYMLRLVQGTLWGPPTGTDPLPDLTLGEGLILAPMAVLVLWIGIYPEPFLARLHEPVHMLLAGTPFALLKGGLP